LTINDGTGLPEKDLRWGISYRQKEEQALLESKKVQFLMGRRAKIRGRAPAHRGFERFKGKKTII